MNKQTILALKLSLELGYQIAIPLVVLALLGRWVDKLFNSSPLFLILGLFLALVSSTYLIYQKIKKINSADDDQLK